MTKPKKMSAREVELLTAACGFEGNVVCNGEPREVCAKLSERGFLKLLGWDGKTTQDPAVYEVTPEGRAYVAAL